ncbi:MAG: Hsp20/alpha crystallin family protein [Acidobacteria bacterium]|nr:Hsp20/alpha crystallin family protein [Acidobacteriota bacterium]
MLTTRWNPFEDLFTLHRDMDRVFGRQWSEHTPRSANGTWAPQSEVAPVENAWQLRVALPGVDPSEVQITLHGNTLRISGERQATDAGQPDSSYSSYSELTYGPFERTFTLPSNVDGDKAEASFRHGMLCLTVPVAEGAKPRRIAISGASLADIEMKKSA